MPERQIITDPDQADRMRERLVDPRTIEAIILAIGQNEAPIQGFNTEADLVISLWKSSNKTCYSVLEKLLQPKLSVHIGSGSIGDACVSAIKSLTDHRSGDLGKSCAFVQTRCVSNYPRGMSGPKNFALITVCANRIGQDHEVRYLGDDISGEILPEFNATGLRLVEFCNAPSRVEPDDVVKQTETTPAGKQRKWWQIWRS